MKRKKRFLNNIYSIFLAIFIAILIRSFVFEPFNIPSGSMKPNLLVGDFIFVSKYSYGYSRHSFPFSLGDSQGKVLSGKYFTNKPKRGDVVVFKTPSNNRTDYIKRVIGLPGDKIKIINGEIFINNSKISRKIIEPFIDKQKNEILINNGRRRQYIEYFFEKEIKVLDIIDFSVADNTREYLVPKNNFFVMGDNRDNSQDSRFNTVGFIPFENIIGKAQFIFFSLENSRFLEFWKWPKSIRWNRIFQKIQ
tara:strand:+ start:1628 stop:2377 length:750 start_codon:yes stop_codon:yes gene_type:complete